MGASSTTSTSTPWRATHEANYDTAMSRHALSLRAPVSVALFFVVGCGPAPRMSVGGRLAGTTAHEVTARPGAFTGDQLAFAPYRASGWREQWTSEDTARFGERFTDFGGEYAYAFALEHEGAVERQVGCRGAAVLQQSDARRNLYSYTVRCSIFDAAGASELAWAEVDLTGGGELAVAVDEEGAEPAVFGVQPVLMSADGRARQDPYGYQLVAEDGPFAAVQADGPRVWIDASETDEALQRDAAALCAALLEGYHWSVAHMRTAR